MSASKKKQTRQQQKLWLLMGILAMICALVLIVWLVVLHGGVQASYQGGDTSTDLPVNTRSAADFTEENGYLHYPGAKLGIDIAEFQGQIDWQAVKAAGIDFAIVRVGYRGYLHGTLMEDACYLQNLQQAREAGISLGVYFFSQAVSEEEAEDEAEFVLSLLDGMPLELPVFFDWEESFSDGSRTLGNATVAVSSYARAFCRRIEAAGYKAGVYFNQQYGYSIMYLEQLGDYTFWLAEYDNAPLFFYDFTFWQYTGSGWVDGISTSVDLDLYFEPESG